MNPKELIRNKLYSQDGKYCHYCGIYEEDFIRIWGEFYGGRKRGPKLEVDRKDNLVGYEIDNCVLACAICNNAKSDKFTYAEFKLVGKIIQQIWERRKIGASSQTENST